MSELFAVGMCIVIAIGFALLFGVNFTPLLHTFYPFKLVYNYFWVRPKKIKLAIQERKKAEIRVGNMIIYYQGDRNKILQIEGNAMTQIEHEVLNRELPKELIEDKKIGYFDL
jgi:hypothetical protein